MEFKALHYADRLRVVNPRGDVGVVTLWSRIDAAMTVLNEQGVDLSGGSSRVAVVGNLYGNGLPHMLRNLLWNPQIAHLLVIGEDLSGSRDDLLFFFKNGIEETEFLGVRTFRIDGRQRVIDGTVTPAHFERLPSVTAFSKLRAEKTVTGIREFFASLPPLDECEWPRKELGIPEPEVIRFPAEARSQTILRETPLEAWQELVFRLMRFGHRTKLEKGERIELQNVKVVLSKPEEDCDDDVIEVGFDPETFRKYQRDIINPEKRADLTYTYGNRLRGYFDYEGEPVDSLEIVIKRFQNDMETRHAYVSLWDARRDLPVGHDCPCLVSLFFRLFEGTLTLTATFRTHNALDAWPENLWGLIAIQRYVAERVRLPPGPITVFSHSISVSADSLDRAKIIANKKVSDECINPQTGKRQPRMDPNGTFTVTVDQEAGEIVVEHSYEGVPLHEYRGKHAQDLERQLARDCALSEISHALYLGREIVRAEQRLKSPGDESSM